jgi:hypothetical protein
MHYYGNETIMSLEQVLRLKPSEIRVLEWVRTYEYLENSFGLDDPVNTFIEIKWEGSGVRVRKNRITQFPAFECEQEEYFDDVETALALFRDWAKEILAKAESSDR